MRFTTDGLCYSTQVPLILRGKTFEYNQGKCTQSTCVVFEITCFLFFACAFHFNSNIHIFVNNGHLILNSTFYICSHLWHLWYRSIDLYDINSSFHTSLALIRQTSGRRRFCKGVWGCSWSLWLSDKPMLSILSTYNSSKPVFPYKWIFFLCFFFLYKSLKNCIFLEEALVCVFVTVRFPPGTVSLYVFASSRRPASPARPSWTPVTSGWRHLIMCTGDRVMIRRKDR